MSLPGLVPPLPAPPARVARDGTGRGPASGGPIALVDWRRAPADVVTALFEREQREWWDALSWDASDDWVVLETARRAWRLPGLLALDAHGQVRGWTYLHREGRTLFIGALVADSPHVTGMLIDAAVDASDQAGIPAIACFLPERAAGVHDALAARGFMVAPFVYMAKTLGAASIASRADWRLSALPVDLVADNWRPADIASAAELLAVSYGSLGRHFAPGGHLEEWEVYVRRLIEYTGCGHFDPSTSRVLRDVGAAPGYSLRALVLMTTISPEASHVAQIAVHPERRRQGLARRLIEAACYRAARAGRRRTTLLVAQENRGACALYESMGFQPAVSFLSARRERACQPVRSTSVALASGGETTRL